MRRIVASIAGVGMAIGLSQFPEYAQQYTQRLGGAVDELAGIVAEFDRAAAEGGLDRAQALERFEQSDDSFLAGRGNAMVATLDRYQQLSQTLVRIENASAFERLQLLPDFMDSDIGGRTLEVFKPAVPVTFEGFAYAGGGLVAGYGLFSGLLALLSLPFRRRHRIRPTRL
ncbi:DUF2937 family protein [Devosia rhodophyticola]|uniref:DUF2937 family protein n=1 Tax=Devosia rhodophyticola TaxID=3026423 RepID=A0ABY7Z0U0_9HYPH|nr:DUF2937 family protein [Devosia rhodophyticola]WDR06913.1 DUF2937 family protein [Devosia rhodophyticola]